MMELTGLGRAGSQVYSRLLKRSSTAVTVRRVLCLAVQFSSPLTPIHHQVYHSSTTSALNLCFAPAAGLRRHKSSSANISDSGKKHMKRHKIGTWRGAPEKTLVAVEEFPPPETEVRVNRLVKSLVPCSHREADKYIANGWVKVNGVVATTGMKALTSDKIEIDLPKDKILKLNIMLYKPVGYISQSSDPKPRQRFASWLLTMENKMQSCRYKGSSPHHLEKLAVCGRLDADSEGLLIFSQNGNIARAIIGDSTTLEKEYIVRVVPADESLSLEAIGRDKLVQQLSYGMSLDGRKLKPAKVKWLNESQLQIILSEGRHRQIRRMCEQIGLKVTRLKRVRVGNLPLGSLKVGEWRTFYPDELLGSRDSK